MLTLKNLITEDILDSLKQYKIPVRLFSSSFISWRCVINVAYQYINFWPSFLSYNDPSLINNDLKFYAHCFDPLFSARNCFNSNTIDFLPVHIHKSFVSKHESMLFIIRLEKQLLLKCNPRIQMNGGIQF